MTAVEATGDVAEDEQRKADRPGSVLRSGAVMAAGSVVSRATGFIRSAVVVAALGTGGQVVETLGEWETSVGGAANNTLYRAFQAYLARR